MVYLKMGWMAEADCKNEDPEIFFNTRDKAGIARAKEVCNGCNARFKCDEYAESLDMVEFKSAGIRLDGVWSGRTKKERVSELPNAEAVERRGFAPNQGPRRRRGRSVL